MIIYCWGFQKVTLKWSPEPVSSCFLPQALYLATLGGANALGLSSHLGSFEEGKCFDAVVLRRGFGSTPVGWTSEESKEDLLLKIITLGDDRNVKEVFVDGRSVYQAQDAWETMKEMGKKRMERYQQRTRRVAVSHLRTYCPSFLLKKTSDPLGRGFCSGFILCEWSEWNSMEKILWVEFQMQKGVSKNRGILKMDGL